MEPENGHWRIRLRRLWCAMYGHRIRFPENVWADLTCRRCDWTGPELPAFPLGTFHGLEQER